jgi:rSAM/selenodomain-associated transferase 1
MRPKVIVFARVPKAGAVKTRLGAVMSAASAAGLHLAMVTDLIRQLQQLHPGVDLELHTSEPTDAFSFLDVVTRVQVSGTLGDRLLAAIFEALEQERRPAVLIIGSDSPTLPLAHIHELLATEADAAIGPASDGGYYAIVCRKAHVKMFDGVTWSVRTTAAETVQAMQKCGFTVALGPEWYDIDTPADLQRLATDTNLGSATRTALQAAARL